MDVIWPGFQSIVTINLGKPVTEKVFTNFWGDGCCSIMRHYPLPQQILALGEEGLRQFSIKYQLRIRATTIKRLLRSAELALIKTPEDLEIELLHLQMKLDDLERAKQKISILEQKIEDLLVQTSGVLLLSVPQIGVLSAAEFIAELGPVDHFTHAGQIIKKAGTNPLVKQSGGKEAFYGKISKQGNPNFRAVIYRIGYTLGLGVKNGYFKAFAHRLWANGKSGSHVWIAIGNKFIKVAFAMLRDKKLFAPPLWDGPPSSKDPLAKIKDKNNQIVAQTTLSYLLYKQSQEKVG